MRIVAAVLAFIALAACGSPCSTQRVVQSRTPPGLTLDQIAGHVDYYDVELDDGHVYRGSFEWPLKTSREVEVCTVASKIDGSEHFSVRYGSYTVNVQRLR